MAVLPDSTPVPASRRGILRALTAMPVVGAIATLPALTVPSLALAADPHEAYRERLHIAHAERTMVRPVSNHARYGTLEDRAARLVAQRMWRLTEEVIGLPPPRTLTGLGVLGLAMAIRVEGCADPDDSDVWPEVQLARGILAVTGEKLPPKWCCWGDAPGDHERDADLYEGLGTLPAWALAEAAENGDRCGMSRRI